MSEAQLLKEIGIAVLGIIFIWVLITLYNIARNISEIAGLVQEMKTTMNAWVKIQGMNKDPK